MPAKNDRMSKRERVEAELNLQETDRTPVYDILLNDAVIEHFTGKFPPVGEEGLKLKLQATAMTLDMTRMTGASPQEPGDWTSPDGFVHYRKERWISGGLRKRPFSDEEGARKWLAGALKDMRKEMDIKGFAEAYHANLAKYRGYLGDDTVLLDEYGPGLDWVRFALGFELFAYVSIGAPELISEYIELYTAREVRKIHAVADRKLSPCALTYGDIACKGALMHSPDWLRREFLPPLKRIQDALHEHGVKCLFHSDGYLMEIMPDLIESGIDGLNPIEVVAGMDLAEVKRLYGDKIFFAGGIDISQLMSLGTPDQVREACRRAIDVASPGYFIGSTTEFDNGSKLGSFLAMVETAWTHTPRKRRRRLTQAAGTHCTKRT
jgi:uroporphyrinogen decarboxylase